MQFLPPRASMALAFALTLTTTTGFWAVFQAVAVVHGLAGWLAPMTLACGLGGIVALWHPPWLWVRGRRRPLHAWALAVNVLRAPLALVAAVPLGPVALIAAFVNGGGNVAIKALMQSVQVVAGAHAPVASARTPAAAARLALPIVYEFGAVAILLVACAGVLAVGASILVVAAAVAACATVGAVWLYRHPWVRSAPLPEPRPGGFAAASVVCALRRPYGVLIAVAVSAPPALTVFAPPAPGLLVAALGLWALSVAFGTLVAGHAISRASPWAPLACWSVCVVPVVLVAGVRVDPGMFVVVSAPAVGGMLAMAVLGALHREFVRAPAGVAPLRTAGSCGFSVALWYTLLVPALTWSAHVGGPLVYAVAVALAIAVAAALSVRQPAPSGPSL